MFTQTHTFTQIVVAIVVGILVVGILMTFCYHFCLSDSGATSVRALHAPAHSPPPWHVASMSRPQLKALPALPAFLSPIDVTPHSTMGTSAHLSDWGRNSL